MAEEARFPINLEGNAAEQSDLFAESLEAVRDRIVSNENAIKVYSASLRRLRGNTNEVKLAKDELKAKINGLRDEVSGLTQAAVKTGAPLDALASKAKAAEAPSGLLGQRLESLKKGLGSVSTASGAAQFALVGVAAAVVAVVAAAGSGALALARFTVEGANAARTQALFAEAATGSEANARALGTQIDALTRKVSTSRQELAEQALGLAKAGIQGQTLVDAMNATAQAADALGGEAASKIRGMIEAGRLSQRFFATRESLIGTGVSFDELSKSLADSMKVGVNDARAALAEGRVSLGVGAAALRAAVEKKFGAINARKMLDINVQAAKFRERMVALTSGVNLEPLLRGVERFTGLLDTGSVTGAALKTIITGAGNALGKMVEKVAPIAEQFFKGLVIGGLLVAVAVLKVRKQFQETFGDSQVLGSIDAASVALNAGKLAAGLFAATLAVVGVAVAAVGAHVLGTVATVQKLVGFFEAGRERIRSIEWSQVGSDIVAGIAKGITSKASAAVDAVRALGSSIKKTFTGDLEIRSPSRFMFRKGQDTTRGAALGMRSEIPRVEAATSALTGTVQEGSAPNPSKPAAPEGSAAATSGGVVRFEIVIRGDASPGAARSPDFEAAVLAVFRAAAIRSGMPVPVLVGA